MIFNHNKQKGVVDTGPLAEGDEWRKDLIEMAISNCYTGKIGQEM